MRKLLSACVALGTVLAAFAVGAAPASAEASTQSVTTVRYGPFTIPGGSMDMPGMIENRLLLNVAKPCQGCYITRIEPDLTYTDGSNANVDSGPMLHHTVLSSAVRSDPTCGTNLLGLIGQRFFASGNERTVVEFPAGFGYQVPVFDSWNMIVDLMNHDAEAKSVYISLKYTHTTATQTRVTPVWLDIDQCGDSEYYVPAGESDSHWEWQVNVPGRIVSIGGHLHNDGMHIRATNQTTGQTICQSDAAYGESPEYIDMMGMEYVSSMSKCVANPVAQVATNQVVRIHSMYHSMVPQYVMGIMIGYIAP